MQCKDIPDRPVLEFLRDLPFYEHVSLGRRIQDKGTWFEGKPNSVAAAMPPGTPEKLVLAKMRMLERRGLIEGCTCGCRGDFELTAKGREMVER